MRMTSLLAAASLAALLAGVAAAQPGPMGGHGRDHDGPGRGGPDRGAMAIAMLGAADANGDNQVTRAEVEALRAAEFAYRDRTGDGFLTIEDASPTMQAMRAMRGEPDAGEGRRGRRGEGGGEGRDRMDADGDGRLSRAEFLGAPSPAFDRLDADSDDVVTGAEIDAAMSARAERGEERRARFTWWRD